MATKYRQISLKDTFSDCQDMFIEDTPSFFHLLDEHFDINEFIPSVFTNAFYQHLGRNRVYPLSGFLSALILQKIFSIPTDSLLIIFCPSVRNFAIFAAFPRSPMLLCSPDFGKILNPILNLCSGKWSILRSQSANSSTLPLLRSLPLTPLVLSSLLTKTIPKPSML